MHGLLIMHRRIIASLAISILLFGIMLPPLSVFGQPVDILKAGAQIGSVIKGGDYYKRMEEVCKKVEQVKQEQKKAKQNYDTAKVALKTAQKIGSEKVIKKATHDLEKANKDLGKVNDKVKKAEISCKKAQEKYARNACRAGGRIC